MKHIRHLIIQQKKNAEGGSVETVSSAVITALYNMSKDEQLVYNSTDLKGDLHCAVGSSKQINSLMAQYPNLSIEADTYTIDFEDPEFERICIEKWGNNGVVTENQLAAVTNVGWDTFTNNTTLTKATDLIYFTGITGRSNTPRLLYCTNLTEITIPPNLHDLDGNFCQGCTNLVTVNGLDHVQSLYSPFSNCPSLTSLVFTGLTGECNIGEITNSQLTNIEINEGCTLFRCILRNSGGPTTFNVPASVQTITFTCPNVTTITFAQNTQLKMTQGYGGFSGCRNLTTLVNFPWDTWTTMGSYCFNECRSLQGTIKTPVGQTTIEQNALVNLKAIDKIIVDSAVTTVGGNNFSWIKTGAKIIMNPTTPPTLSHSVSGEDYGRPNTTGCIFYVPDASYNDYISNGGQYWTELYNNGRIKKMSELPS